MLFRFVEVVPKKHGYTLFWQLSYFLWLCCERLHRIGQLVPGGFQFMVKFVTLFGEQKIFSWRPTVAFYHL